MAVKLGGLKLGSLLNGQIDEGSKGGTKILEWQDAAVKRW
jgi:hypothetical protein